MDAARTASAPPAVSPSYRWSSPPTPPEAITGIPTRSTMARVSRMSYPSRVPSRSMLVSRISPAPHSSIRADQSTASISVGVRPPWVTTSHSPGRPGIARASIATTVHWLPNRSAALLTNSGSATAAVLIDTLSAPAESRLRMSSSVRTPPPTVSGMNTCSAVRRTTSIRMSRFSWDAVMSRKVSSSASSSSYRRATSTGSPASRKETNRTPLTTRPSFTSRHGMILLASMFAGSLPFYLQGVGERDGAVVDRTPDHHPAQPVGLHLPKRRKILHRADASGGDDGGRKPFGELADTPEVGPRQHAVPGDVRVHEPGDPALLHLAREVDGRNPRDFHPAPYGDNPLLGVDPGGHHSGVRLGDPQHFLGVPNNRGAENDPGGARPEIAGGDVEVAHPPSHLDRHVHRVHDAADDPFVHRPAGERAVEVYHVDHRRPCGCKPPCHLQRGVGKHSGVILPPLAETDRLPPLDVDRGNHLEPHRTPLVQPPGPRDGTHASRQSRPKLDRMASPAPWLFSGRNWTAIRFPFPTAAANATPYEVLQATRDGSTGST